MTYNEIIIDLNTSELSKATDIITVLDLGGIYTEDYSDLEETEIVRRVGLIDEELLKKDRSRALIHIYVDENKPVNEYAAFIRERFLSENIDSYTIHIKKIDEEDYYTSFKKYYKKKKIKNIVIVPEWEKYTPNANEKILIIDPGMAFGTGTHETTSMCIEAIQQYINTGDTVFDIGTGSGILSIASLLCGAKQATAVDIDKNAVKTAYENAALNSVEKQFNSYILNILTQPAPEEKFNIVIANIVADVIISALPKIKTVVEKIFIASGIITERTEDVLTALSENDFEVAEIKEKNGWSCIIAEVK